jgi:alpha-galactosidase/6-phospho-beta-glucosidase family protein
MRVTIVGGGSYQWGPKLITDLLGTPSLAGMELVLEDIDSAPLEELGAYARAASEKMGTPVTVTTTTDQRRALEGADYVVVTISTGGFASMAVDLEVPARHGIHQSVGDSVGPGGISRSLRNVPVLVGIGRDVEELCPDAWLLNITNPMSVLTRALCRETRAKAIGLCHEVGNFSMDLAITLGLPHTALRTTVAGVNHFPVITELEIDGTEGFGMIADLLDRAGGVDALRAGGDAEPPEPFSPRDFFMRHLFAITVFDRFGALPAANDRHLVEFVPWALTEASGRGAAWGVGLTRIADREAHQSDYEEEVRGVLAGTREMETWDSGELVAPVIDSLETGERRELPVNTTNEGQCPDLPPGAMVESICVVDGQGVRGRDVARAPAPLAELLRRHVAVHELTIDAAMSGDRSLVEAALALDPLAGRGDFVAVEAMVDELLAGTARWLPQFAS